MNEQANADVGRAASPYWTIEEAADYCKLHVNTVQHLCRTGQIPARKFGRQWRILKRDIEVADAITAPGNDYSTGLRVV